MATIQDRIQNVLKRNKSKTFTNAELAKKLCIPEPSIRRVTFQIHMKGLINSTTMEPYRVSYKDPNAVVPAWWS